MKKIIIALGGNAILKKGEKPKISNQIKNIKIACKNLFNIIKKNQVVITHGNGPQAGYLLMQQKAPLDVIDAETEGQIGYLIEQELSNLFKKNKIKKEIITILTRVLVDKKDKAFSNPNKFVGSFYSKHEADKLKNKFKIKKDSNKGYRRVVPSPKPIKIIEKEAINNLLSKKRIIIAAGGGGIPVIKINGNLKGIEAIIDKDLASACLANSIKAQELIIITDIDGVYLNYNTKKQKKITKTNLTEIKKYYSIGHFPEGNMGPKIEATINFLENSGKKVIITDINNINKGGTTIIR